ncbi:MAG: hypothetical protein KBC22_01945 [Candidatus Pacebacteria bacterium]|nr:hypothetical protein [Candidatus Paceibacterota bacterium]
MAFKKNTHGGPIGSSASAQTSATPRTNTSRSPRSTSTTTTTAESTAPPSGVRKDLVPVGFLYGSRVVNVILALITHTLIAAAIFTGVAQFLPDEILFEGITLIVSVAMSAVLYFYLWTTDVAVGKAVTLTFWGALTDAWLLGFRWWTPFWLFSATEYDAKREVSKLAGFSSISAHTEADGKTLVVDSHSHGEKEVLGRIQPVPLSCGETKAYWIPSGVQYAFIDKETIDEGIGEYILGELRKEFNRKSWTYLLDSGSMFENRILTSPDLVSMCEQWGITLFKVNLGSIDFSKEFKEAIEKVAIARETCKTEDLLIKHMVHMLSDLAKPYKDAGMDPVKAMKLADELYQAQFDKILRVAFRGLSGSSGGDFLPAKALDIAEAGRAARKVA